MYNGPPDVAPVFAMVFGLVMVFFGLLFFALTTLISCKIFSKAGYSWAMGLLMLVPIVNFIMLLVLAFSDWPVQKELRLLKQPVPPA